MLASYNFDLVYSDVFILGVNDTNPIRVYKHDMVRCREKIKLEDLTIH